MSMFQELLARCGSTHNKVDGLTVPFFVQQETLDKLKELQLYPDDVWVVSYPKCGTTWMQQIVRLIRNNGVQDDVKIDKAVPWLEAFALFPGAKFDQFPRPRAFKSHMPYDLCPCGPPNTMPCKYIYVMRNPKDVAVSYYFHYQKVPLYPEYQHWDKFWKNYVEGSLDYGNYFDHLMSWWSHRDDENVFILKYEDMKRDLPAAVSQVASFIGADISSDVIAKIAALTDFEAMKKDATVKKNIPKQPGGTDFYRKGKVGDWKNLLSPEQSAEVDTICAKKFEGTGLQFGFE